MKTPKFNIDDKILSPKYMGKITGAFYTNDEWNYNIGFNTSIEPIEGKPGVYLSGWKYIIESEVTHIRGINSLGITGWVEVNEDKD